MLVGLVGKREDRRAEALVATLCEELDGLAVDVVVDPTTGEAFEAAADDPRAPRPETPPPSADLAAMAEAALVVSVGGDGTFLYAIHGAGATPVMGVNLGEVGFLNTVAPGDAVAAVREAVERIRADGAPRTRELPRVVASGEDWRLAPALNEVVVHGPRRGHGQGIDVDVLVDGESYASTHADGVLVATTTGSTAYNLSEGGPLVHPGVDTMLVTPMCAAGGVPPLSLPLTATVTLEIDGGESALAVSDGRDEATFDLPATVRIERAPTPARVAGPPMAFFEALDKLDRD